MFKRIRDFPRRLRFAFRIAFKSDLKLLARALEDEKVFDIMKVLAGKVLEGEEIFGQGNHDVFRAYLPLDEDEQKRQYIEHGEQILEESRVGPTETKIYRDGKLVKEVILPEEDPV